MSKTTPILVTLACIVCAGGGYFIGRMHVRAADPKPAVSEEKPVRRAAPVKIAEPKGAEADRLVAAEGSSQPSEDGAEVEETSVRPTSAPRRLPKEVVSHAEALEFVSTELADMWGDDKAKTAEGLRRLGALGRATLLACLRERMRLGSAQERESAVLTIGALFGEESGKMKKMVDDGKGSFAPAEDDEDGGVVSDRDTSESMSPAEREARQTKEIVKAIADGLSDADDNVRNAAYDAMRALSREEAGILEGQIFSGNDPELKQALLADAAATKGEAGVMTSIAGLENADSAVAAKAAENLKAVTGQDFATEQQALDWLEAHGDEIKAQGAETVK